MMGIKKELTWTFQVESHMSDTLKIQHRPNIYKLYPVLTRCKFEPLSFVPDFHQLSLQHFSTTPFLSTAVKAWLSDELRLCTPVK